MDNSDPLVSLLIIFVSLTASAFFSGSEIAFVSANRLKIELDNQQGKLSGKILSFFYKKPSYFIGTMLVGNNIALVIYGIEMGDLLTSLFTSIIPFQMGEVVTLLIQTIISTIIILFTAEFIPKALFRANPNNLLSILSIPLTICYGILWVIMVATVGLSEGILRVFGIKQPVKQEQTFGKVDLDHYVTDVINATDEKDEVDTEIKIFQNALDLSKGKARDCMLPRNEIVALDEEATVKDLKQKFAETRLSKIIVYRENIDNIIGYVHSYDLFKKPESIKSILLPLFIVPETMSTQLVLEKFIQERRGIALVVDEFGGTSGMLTIEDVIEEIVGEIEDEHDEEETMEVKISNSEYIFSGRSEIDILNEKFALQLPESDEYETLGGLIIQHLEEIPEAGDKLLVEPYKFIIETMQETRIDKVRVKIVEES